MKTILHITSRQQWEEAQKKGEYRHPSLDKDGFIHCSKLSQVVQVANEMYWGRTGLVILEIDETRVTPKVKHEAGDRDEYPHIYGALNVGAVKSVHDFVPRVDGTFSLPPELRARRRK
jgi:uncharacterized protein (DUF952 family)